LIEIPASLCRSFESGADALVALTGANLPVEVECLPQRDVHRAEAAADRSRNGALEGDAVLADGVENVLGKGISAVLVHDVGSGLLDVPFELDSGGLEDPAGGLRQLGADAVAGDESDSMSHTAATLAKRWFGPVRVDSAR
jgi:hypothetical protein